MFFDLEKNLLQEFGVKSKLGSLYANQDPKITLVFPNSVTYLIKSKLSTPGQDISQFALQASLTAKGNALVPTFASNLKAIIINDNPYEILVQGLYPIVYCFAGILTQKQ